MYAKCRQYRPRSATLFFFQMCKRPSERHPFIKNRSRSKSLLRARHLRVSRLDAAHRRQSCSDTVFASRTVIQKDVFHDCAVLLHQSECSIVFLLSGRAWEWCCECDHTRSIGSLENENDYRITVAQHTPAGLPIINLLGALLDIEDICHGSSTTQVYILGETRDCIRL